MKNILTALTCSIFGALGIIQCSAQTQSEPFHWTATVKVVGVDGAPIADANVALRYDLPPQTNSVDGGEGIDWAQIKGTTDTNGMFYASHTDSTWQLGIAIDKTGFYRSHSVHSFLAAGTTDDKTLASNRNVFATCILEKTGIPIPMYAKRVEAKIPKENEAVGFDLMAGDWVAPYGTGSTADMLITTHRDIIGDHEYSADLKLAFKNKGDGIITVPVGPNADTILRHVAPTTDYQPEQSWKYQNHVQKPETAAGYFLRVRTVLDENGNVKSTLYGKIEGDFRYYVGTKAPQPGIGFNYYLNPEDNSRNVEFDPTKNLFHNLTPDQELKEP